jgi:hypothetical protein
MYLRQSLSWKLLLPIGIVLLSSFAWFYLSESFIALLALVGFVMVLVGTVDLIRQCRKDRKNIPYLILFVFIFLILFFAPWMTSNWSKKQILGFWEIDDSWSVSTKLIPFGRFVTAYEPGPNPKGFGFFMNIFGGPTGEPTRYGGIGPITTKTQDISDSEGEESLEIYPYDADVAYCRDSKGVEHPTTGRESASWFEWGGCANNKYYNVVSGEQLVFHVHTDSCSGCLCYYPNFSIYEYRKENWEKVRDFNLPNVKGITEDVLYTPSSDKIKIYASDCFYLDVYSGDREKIEQELARELEIKEESAQEIVNKFMNLRINGYENKALIYLTEVAREQFLGSGSELILTNSNFFEYEISQFQRIDEATFRFIVRIKVKGEPGHLVEIIDAVEILGDFFIGTVQLPG